MTSLSQTYLYLPTHLSELLVVCMTQLIVPGGYWKATVLTEGDWGLLGEAVAPGGRTRPNHAAVLYD